MVFADIPIIVDVVFWIVSLFTIFGCVAIISVNNIFKSAVFLALTMDSIAILYFLLRILSNIFTSSFILISL